MGHTAISQCPAIRARYGRREIQRSVVACLNGKSPPDETTNGGKAMTTLGQKII
jgi:hypothetical protein